MKAERVLYRVGQFWLALSAAPAPEDIELVRQYLAPAQMGLFLRMQPGEQAHSLRAFKQLRAKGSQAGSDHSRDLFVAVLLHDVGKSRHPLRIWERVLIVCVKALMPDLAKRLGKPGQNSRRLAETGELTAGWRRPFIVAEQHADWGAEMAAAAGVSPLAVSLIRKHQQPVNPNAINLEERLLYELQAVDGNT